MKSVSKASALCASGSLLFSGVALGQIEEVIVTAQKRSESQQDVPIAIQAISGAQLAESGIENVQDLGVVTPGLQLTTTGTGNAPYIRGVGGSNVTAGQESPVPVYVDGVYYQFPLTSSLSFNNIERIEVLKGPQGTLFGRNATGGLIHVVTVDPVHETSGVVSLTGGNYETYGGNLYATTGLTDSLAADLAVYYTDRGEGFGENVLNGQDTLLREELAARSKWKYTGEATEVTAIVDYSHVEGNKGLSRDLLPGAVGIGGTGTVGGFYDVQAHVENTAVNYSKGASVRVDHSFSSFDLVSITAYRDDRTNLQFDGAVSSAIPLGVNALYEGESATQELQLVSNNAEGDTWIVGAFFMDSSGLADLHLAGPLLGGSGLAAQNFGGEIDTRSYSAFGEYRRELTDRSRLTLGLRYTYDERSLTGHTVLTPLGGAPNALPVPDQKADWREPTWRLIYDFGVTEDVLLYASYNRGFKSGNFDAVAPRDPAFDPETLDAYEIGMKSDLLGGRLRLNVSGYYYDYKNLQLQILRTIAVSTENAAEAEILGLDMDLIAQLTDSFELELGFSALDGEYKSYPNATSFVPTGVGGNTLTTIDASGGDLQRTPSFTGNVGGAYRVQTSAGDFTASVRAAYNDGFAWEPDGRLRQDAYTLLNASLGWQAPSGVWGVRLTGRNLTDEEYSIHSAATATGDFYAPGDPRTYELTVDYRF